MDISFFSMLKCKVLHCCNISNNCNFSYQQSWTACLKKSICVECLEDHMNINNALMSSMFIDMRALQSQVKPKHLSLQPEVSCKTGHKTSSIIWCRLGPKQNLKGNLNYSSSKKKASLCVDASMLPYFNKGVWYIYTNQNSVGLSVNLLVIQNNFSSAMKCLSKYSRQNTA